VSYCINPRCDERENPEEAPACLSCGTSLLINNRFRILQPLRPIRLDHATDVFEVVDEQGSWISPPGVHKVLKVLKSKDEKYIALQAREAHCLQMLDHPGIPKVDLDDHFSIAVPGMPFPVHCMAMEKLEGVNLEEWIEEHGRISQPQALNWLEQIAQILHHVHERGFFHRDIKPSNIVLKPDGALGLIDFGGSREVTDTYLAKISSGSSDTSTGKRYDITLIRSTRFSPPEQIDGQAIPQSDFFALGRTFVYLTTGIPLIDLPVNPETRKLRWRNKAPQIGKPLADFLDELMENAPTKRPKNTQAIVYHLQKRLPRQLKRYRMRRSPQVRIGLVVLGAFSVFGVYKVASLAAYYYYFFVGLQVQRSDLPGSAQAARGYFEKAAKSNPQSINARLNLAETCQDSGDNTCAQQEYQKAVAIDPKDPETHYNLGDFYDLHNKYALAESEFTKAMQLGADQEGMVSSALARLKNRQKDYNAALPYAQQAVAKAEEPQAQAIYLKNLGWTLLGLAKSQQQQGRSPQAKRYYQQAQEQLEQSIQQDPTRPDAYCLLAQVQEGQGNKVGANQNWRECLQRNNFLDLPEVNQWRNQVLNRVYKTGGDTTP